MSLTEQRAAMPDRARPRSVAPVIFSATIFLSAALLFFVQPLFAKLILPRIGGAPAVWTTAMLFFQTVLIAGYVYAHLLIRFVPQRWQIYIHLAFWALALSFLPLSVSETWTYDATRPAALQALILLAIGVGVPFAMLSANAPLIQAWYARSGGPSAEDPYFLYGASNLGALIALLAFPLLAEPFFGTSAIGLVWTVGFVLLGLGLGIAGCLVARRPPSPAAHSVPSAGGITARDLAVWAAIAFVPSSLMLSVTTEISTDLGAFPLIWVVPLSLYILSFVVTFTQRGLPRTITRPAALVALALLAVLVSNHSNSVPAPIKAVLFAPALFAVAVEAHRMLYARRPDPTNLTVFYITLSVGGALGGVANSLVAPWALSDVHEGVLSVFAAGVLLALGAGPVGHRAILRAALTAILTVALVYARSGALIVSLPDWAVLGAALFLVLAATLVWRLPLAILGGIAAFLTIDAVAGQRPHQFRDRSFFGSHAVKEVDGLRLYVNGTTIHGVQQIREAGRPTPISYYHPLGPMAEVLNGPVGQEAKSIGIVGLGVGSLACYARPGQHWAFYEIDAMVDRVARDPALFSFISECAPDAPTYLGDARIMLAGQEIAYDILVLDAYSSDSIPLHLVTREAVATYLNRLTADGTLVFHISNRYYDIGRPLARIGAEAGLHMAIRAHRPDLSLAEHRGASQSIVVVMSPSKARLEQIAGAGWERLASDGGVAWTDDFTNLLAALK